MPPILPRTSGDVIVRVHTPSESWAAVLVAELAELLGLGEEGAPPPHVERLILSRSFAEVELLEAEAALSPFPPLRSLNSYFRVHLRDRPGAVPAVLAHLATLPWVGRAWAELVTELPADPLARLEPQLRPAPDGVNARNAAVLSPGKGAHLATVEHGWSTSHVDLAGYGIGAPLWGDNIRKAATKPGDRRANHGTSSLGAAVGRRNGEGVEGVAPATSGVTISSCWLAATDIGEYVASAIVALVDRTPAGTVLLLEVQRDFLPTEVDEADFHAIRLACAFGIVVVEPAGNGAADLDRVGSPVGRLDPTHPAWQGDSGAIVVGATVAGSMQRWAASNFGRRVDCCAAGQSVVSAGQPKRPDGALKVPGAPNDADHAWRSDFGGTSAAAAIVAGVALVLVGEALRRGRQPPLSSDVRAWLRGNGTPSLHERVGTLPDLAQLATSLPASTPRRRPGLSLTTSPGRGHTSVTNPQTSEGNSGIRDVNGVDAGTVVTVAGSTGGMAVPGAAPPLGLAQTEHWVVPSMASLAMSGEHRVQFVPGVPGPTWGTWSMPPNAGWKQIYPSGWFANASFTYQNPPNPAAVAAEQALGETPLSDLYYKLYRRPSAPGCPGSSWGSCGAGPSPATPSGTAGSSTSSSTSSTWGRSCGWCPTGCPAGSGPG